jgi:GNAT superfamily N-acetyltransferase
VTSLLAPSLRSAQDDETELVFAIYASTREEELAQVPWERTEKEAFLRMQFAAQDRYYRGTFPHASYDLIVAGSDVLGRLYVDRESEAVLVLDLALLPSHRGQGIGTMLLQRVLAEAGAAGKPVRIHVERFNPARRLYERLGFRVLADQGVYLLMECVPYPNTAS